MFILNFSKSKILKKLLLILAVFIVINLGLFYYLQKYTVIYRPLERKAEVLFSKYPDSRVIIGGDSTVESGISPQIISPNNGINIATPATGIHNFYKALLKYNPNPLSDKNILIVNASIINFNDEVIDNDRFLSQMDIFFDAGIPFLISHWKRQFFENLFSVYQCVFSSCKYISDLPYPDLEKTDHHGFIPYRNPPGVIKSQEEKKKLLALYESHYKNFELEGVIFENFKTTLANMSKTQANIFIIYMPTMKVLNERITALGAIDKLKHFINHTQAECEKYKKCYFLNYLNWDTSILPGTEDENFFDYIHFTRKGGEAFSLILKKDIENKLKGNKI